MSYNKTEQSLPPAEGATDKFRDVLHEVQRLIETEGGATESEMKAIWNSLSCAITESERRQQPTAEGAEKRTDLRLQFERESESFWSVSAIPTIGYVRWLENKVLAMKSPIQPTAEGAEEILEKYGFKIICHKEDADAINDIFVQPIVAAMQEFATLHAQRIADKMVSERLKEELGLYNDWLNGAAGKYLTSPYIDEYLTSEYYLKTRDNHE